MAGVAGISQPPIQTEVRTGGEGCDAAVAGRVALAEVDEVLIRPTLNRIPEGHDRNMVRHDHHFPPPVLTNDRTDEAVDAVEDIGNALTVRIAIPERPLHIVERFLVRVERPENALVDEEIGKAVFLLAQTKLLDSRNPVVEFRPALDQTFESLPGSDVRGNDDEIGQIAITIGGTIPHQAAKSCRLLPSVIGQWSVPVADRWFEFGMDSCGQLMGDRSSWVFVVPLDELLEDWVTLDLMPTRVVARLAVADELDPIRPL